MQKPLRRRILDYSLAVLLLLLPLAILRANSKDRDDLNLLDKVVLRVTSPLQTAFAWIIEGVGGTWNRYVWLVDVEDENNELRAQNRDLRKVIVDARLRMYRVQELERLLELKQKLTDDTAAARVLSVSLSPQFQVVRIAVDRDDVTAGMPVIAMLREPLSTPSGPMDYALVGRVGRVYAGYADVMVLSDPNSVVGVWLPRTGAKGKLRGTLESSEFLAVVENLERDQVQVGDVVMTRGLGQFPEGLPVGTVVSEPEQSDDVSVRVRLQPLVAASDLDFVLVVSWRSPPSDPVPKQDKVASPRALGARPL